MKFCWCTITVHDMEESLNFYQEIVGLSLERRFISGGEVEIAFLGGGDTKIELIHGPSHPAPGQVVGISLGFAVGSVDKTIEFIQKKGLKVSSGPFQPSPQVRYFFVKDPNGVSIQFVENL